VRFWREVCRQGRTFVITDFVHVNSGLSS